MEILRRVRKVLGLPQSKKIIDIPKPVVRDGSYWFQEAQRKSKSSKDGYLKCPWSGCEGDMLSGPSGGMSTNVKCNACDRKWNLTEVIGQMERI
jgi:hypothetical protein